MKWTYEDGVYIANPDEETEKELLTSHEAIEELQKELKTINELVDSVFEVGYVRH